ncbi:hypothetical protein CMV_012835 [Castanea mollissima]|uniref:Uncharacterized protein n=1 Tax=Castanea mollissima TaxID=60419 RepID=A0A8J4REK5_9ROSI|nr:hypothetical protein CMV_012835 [Castanea mollissima]
MFLLNQISPRLFLVMMNCLKGMMLEKGGESMSFEWWLELESNLRMMLGIKLTILRTSAVPSPVTIDGNAISLTRSTRSKSKILGRSSRHYDRDCLLECNKSLYSPI